MQENSILKKQKITNRNGRNAVCKGSPPCTDEIGEKG